MRRAGSVPAVAAKSKDAVIGQMAVDLADGEPVAPGETTQRVSSEHARQRSERPERPASRVAGKDRVRCVLRVVEELRTQPDDAREPDIGSDEDIEVQRRRRRGRGSGRKRGERK